MDRRDSNSSSVTISCNGGDAIRLAIAETHRFCADRGLERGDAARLAIIVEELVTNLVEHGLAEDEGEIELVLIHRDGAVAIRLSDNGLAFDPRTAVSSATVPERGGGAGLDLVRAWTEILVYRSDGTRNRLVLEMRLGG